MPSIARVTRTLAIAAVGAAVAGAVAAQQSPYPMGPGMMGGWGPGMMGPGMMGGHGPGMMGGYGPGMMGGYGMMGPGMMGGCGGWTEDLNLSADQRSQIAKIQDEGHRKRHELMTRLWEEHAKLRELAWAEKRDAKAITEQNRKVYDLRRQMTEVAMETHNRVEAVLNKEQKERWRRYGPWWMDQ